MASFLKSLVNRIGKAFKPKIDQSEMVITLVAHDQFINILQNLPQSMTYLDFTGKCK